MEQDHSNSIAALYPDICEYWDYSLNSGISPEEVTPGSSKEVYWKCVDCNRPFKNKVSLRVLYNRERCAECAAKSKSKKVSKPRKGKCLAEEKPELVNEWDYEKNGDLTPYNVAPASGKKVWWVCKNGHEFKAAISHRRYGSGCPICNTVGTSFGEQFIYWCFKYALNDFDNSHFNVLNRQKIDKLEYDIQVIPLNLCIEYSGANWHEGKELNDMKKRITCELHGLEFIEIIEDTLHDKDTITIDNNRIVYNSLKDRDNKLIKIFLHIANLFGIDTNGIDFSNIAKLALEYSNGELPEERTLAFNYPEIAAEWDSDKNGALTPYRVTPASHIKAWFKCSKNHSYYVSIASRTHMNSGCPYCKNKKVLSGFNDIATLRPDLLDEWDYEANGDLKPTDITPGSGKVVHWKCKKGHRYTATPNSKTAKNYTCPYCGGKKRRTNKKTPYRLTGIKLNIPQ